MKHLARLLSLLILVSAGLFFANCDGGGGNEKSAEELSLDKLKFTWSLQSTKLESVTENRFDGANVKLIMSGNFSAGASYDYAVTADSQVQGSPWPSAGKWKFGSPVTSAITRLDSQLAGSSDPDVSMTYELGTDGKTLTINFNYSGSGFVIGRTESATGNWQFIFTRP